MAPLPTAFGSSRADADGGADANDSVVWLYVRGDESVRLIQLSPVELAVCGPGHKRTVARFTTEDELIEFHHASRAELIAGGYQFAGYGTERRSGADRRERSRAGDRRGA